MGGEKAEGGGWKAVETNGGMEERNREGLGWGGVGWGHRGEGKGRQVASTGVVVDPRQPRWL